ncbi:epsin-2-like, partial [Gigantopelta aegis]|uniref:epsin-2-like n=1 Tax=Gigantopelta aegis TaxID=1735272 RepID=UPI001B88D5D0
MLSIIILDAEVKVREATSNDPWGPSVRYGRIARIYISCNISEEWVQIVLLQQCKDNLFSIETLKDFQFIDKDGKDNGQLGKHLKLPLQKGAIILLVVGDTASPTASFQPQFDQSRPNAKMKEDLQTSISTEKVKRQADEEDKLSECSVCVNKKPTVEESFLGTNAPLVNLDTLIAPLPPPTSINPFGITSIAPTHQPFKTNPFEGAKQPRLHLAHLKMENKLGGSSPSGGALGVDDK